jgi:3-deoxy-D-manno-octulosonate 8-phosphate phosphatase (KDO 8-P phosphatase)
MEVSPTAGNQNNLIYQPQIELVHVFDLMKAVRAFVLDVDGVLTNNDVLVTEVGEFLRTMNVRDGQAIKWAIEKGYPVCVITGGRSEGVIKRLNALGVQQIFSGRHDKLPVFEQFIREFHLSPIEICYMGDDLPDLPVLRKVGLPACPNDAAPEVMAVVQYVSPFEGGKGCVRDIIEKVMKLRGDWPVY